MQDASRKNDLAKELAVAHRNVEPSIVRVVRVLAKHEQDAGEPVILLEVNPETSPSGIVPVAFGAAPPQIPYPSVIIEVTPSEFSEIETGHLPLPEGWHLGETIYPSAN